MRLSKLWRRCQPYGVAIASTLMALLLTLLLEPFLNRTTNAFFFVAVAVTTWRGGLKPGIVTIVLSTLVINYFFIPPRYAFFPVTVSDAFHLVILSLVAFIINFLSDDLRASKRKIEQLNQRLAAESAEQLRVALAAAYMSMWDWNLRTGDLSWSVGHEQLFGFAPGTFNGKYETFEACIYPEDREKLKQAVNRAIQNRTPYQHEFRIVWPDGAVHWMEGRAQIVYDEMAQPVRMSGTVMNIDDRKKSETALERSEQQLRAIFDAEPECVKVITADGILLNMNAAGLFMLEAERLEQVQGQCVCSMVNPSHQQEFLEFTQWVAQGESGILEFEITGLKGTRRWLESHAVPLQTHNEQNEPFTYVLAVTRDVTERKRVEAEVKQLNAELEQRVVERTAELRRSNELLNSFFNAASSAAIGLCIHDRELRFVQINQALADINGYSVEAHLGKTTSELLPELAPIVNPLIQQVLATGQPILNLEIDAAVPSQPEAMRYWLASYFPILGSNGSTQTVGVGVILIEISDRKRAEVALQKSEQKFRAIFEQTFQFIGLLTPDGIFLEINQSPLDFVQTQREAVVRRPLWEFPSLAASAETQAIARTAIAQAAAGNFYRSEVTVPGAGGISATFDFSVKPILDEAGQVTLLIVEGRDISDRKEAEAILEESNQRWQSLLDDVQLVVVGLDRLGNVSYVNPFFLSLTGYDASEVMGQHWFTNFLPASQIQPVNVAFHKVLEQDFHPHYHNPIVLKSGEERMISWSNTILRDADGRIIGTMSIGEDITKRQEVERMKVEFISIVSHELRTPLTAIRGALGLLAAGVYDKKPEKGQRMLQVAAEQSDRLVRLVNDILDLGRLESGKVTLTRKICDAAALIQESVETMRTNAEQNQIALSVNAPLLPVWADSDSIIQTLTNLLSNAIKFSPPHTTIVVSAELTRSEAITGYPQGSVPQSLVLFKVQDQGRGIPADKIEAVFERFQQVDASDSRQKGGTGLGLAICRGIIEQHNGRIWAESVLGQGSTFYLTLPTTPQ
ncbi:MULTISPECIES: PAS domain S-box protein [Trichocoleus]|uniref:histidine kinase n=1 Tax=Trichocoleus desertorum GB2-A4 TaxID=2933944 RepID=A0ABV0JFE9_9CYAN|nr:PAS domain S-box protein [Trichocoleus sp. FACHB-46]MBD1865550.1 PAS domain S-box protein [Trichocoleus sp. FACHB-46]